MARAPFSRRGSDADLEAFYVLREGVPPGLVNTLVEFALAAFFSPRPNGSGLSAQMASINQFARLTDEYISTSPDYAKQELADDAALLLDAVDFRLGTFRLDSQLNKERVSKLVAHLEESRSVYTVGLGGDGLFELQLRQPTELTRLVEVATGSSDRAAEHLRRAWSEAFGRNPNYNAACTEAVAAIEAAAKPVVIPSNPKATLGTIITALKDKPDKWTTDSEADDDIEKVIAMLEMVWKGHFRHGDETKPIEVSKAGAEMVVQQAALLVHWFRSGFVRLA